MDLNPLSIIRRIYYLSTPIKIVLIISSVGIIVSLSYFTLVKPTSISEVGTPIPVTAPIPTTSINWQTPHASLQADSIEISTNTVGSSGPYVIFHVDSTNPSQPPNITSDPPDQNNPNYTTLEAIWHDNNVEMRMFMYFSRNQTENTWKLTKIQTYNGKSPGSWVDSYSGAPELYVSTPVGSPLIIPNLHLSTSGGGYFDLNITNLRLYAFVYPVSSPLPSTPPSPSASPSSTTKTVTLSASPPPTSLRLNQARSLNINAHVNNDSVSAVQLELIYDSTKLKIQNLAPTDYLPNVLSQPVYQPGRILATYAAPPDSGGQSLDWGTVATLTITPLTYGSSTIEFGFNTLVAAASSDNSVLIPPDVINITTYNVADTNRDGSVNIYDYNLFVSQYGLEQSPVAGPADFNRDGKVNIFDYNIFVENYGFTTPTPTSTPTSTPTARLQGPCYSDSDCPDNSTCKIYPRCSPTTVMVDGKLIHGDCPAPRLNQCVASSTLTQHCDSDSDCPTNYSCRSIPWGGCPTTIDKNGLKKTTECAHPPICYQNQ